MLKFPSGTAWRAWRANAILVIISAAGRNDDQAQGWIMEVESEDTSINLDIPGDGWISLDRKLAVALNKISEGELGRQLTLATTAALSKND